ncbi:MAG: 5-nitroimidazole antibiotic resistance protein [Clostridiales bacterium]|nr:pyridoxamine 5'-phosphate oxidase family protein [Bacillota bacterium]PWL94983.1 MAG: 5-nitroimidazole antibiotic resistance protein [Clostridiales bacterium]
MRRADREMPKEFALEIVDKCPYAVISMIDCDAPYALPVSIVRSGDSIYFHCANEGRKAKVLTSYPRVSIVCVGDVTPSSDKFTTEYESAIITGTARKVIKDAEKINALRLICERYTPSNMHNFDRAIEKSLSRTAIWKVDIDSISGKRKKYGNDGKEIKYSKQLLNI